MVHDCLSDHWRLQAASEEVSEEGVRKRRRRGSTAGVQYSEDVSDAAFNRLLQADQASEESASEVCLAALDACNLSASEVCNVQLLLLHPNSLHSLVGCNIALP